MDEHIQNVIGPIENKLEELKEAQGETNAWKLSLYSNGSKGPPGFLETAREQDRKTFVRLFGIARDLTRSIKPLEAFILEQKIRQNLQKERRAFWKGFLLKVGIPVMATILTGTGIAIRKSVPVIHILIEDYIESHPNVLKKVGELNSEKPFGEYAVTTVSIGNSLQLERNLKWLTIVK